VRRRKSNLERNKHCESTVDRTSTSHHHAEVSQACAAIIRHTKVDKRFDGKAPVENAF